MTKTRTGDGGRARPISLKPLKFEKTLEALVAVNPKALKSPKKRAVLKKRPPKKAPKEVAISAEAATINQPRLIRGASGYAWVQKVRAPTLL